jgi:hypothetical protein
MASREFLSITALATGLLVVELVDLPLRLGTSFVFLASTSSSALAFSSASV